MPDLCHSSSGTISPGGSRSFISVTDFWIATLPDKSLFLSSSRTSVPIHTYYPRARLPNCLNPIGNSPCGQPSHAADPKGRNIGVVLGWERAVAPTAELGTSGAVVRTDSELVSLTCHLGLSKSHIIVLITKGL